MRAQPTGSGRVLSPVESMVHQLPTATSQTSEAVCMQDPHHNPTLTPIPYPPPHPSACSERQLQLQLHRALVKIPRVHKAYPESLQKVLPHPQSAPQGGLWPVLISWREVQASGLSTTSQPFLPPGPACPRGGGRCLWVELRGHPMGVMWATVGGVQEAESSSWGQESPLPPGVPTPPPGILTPPEESPFPLPPGIPTPGPFVVFHVCVMEEKMATHSSILAWKIPWTEGPGGLQSIGSQRVGQDCCDLAHPA